MTEITTIPETHLAILELLTSENRPMASAEIEERIGDRFPAKGAIGNMQSMGRIEGVKLPDQRYVSYKPTKQGLALLRKKESLNVTPYKAKEGLKKGAKGKGKPAPMVAPIAPPLAPLNVSTNADRLMDTISSVIQENNAYREAIIRACNQMAGMLGMKLVPIEQESENNN